eukprot:maker-scaffold_2-snap-gene-0.6-mRNA-1 protein AED:0.12 eAED:0.12 QI:95/1/1/1/0.66/0.5/4/137/676
MDSTDSSSLSSLMKEDLSSSNLSSADAESLIKAENEAKQENEIEYEKEKQETLEDFDEKETNEALNMLLSKAIQYTKFLKQKQLSSIEESEPSNKKRKTSLQPITLTGGTLKDYQVTGYRWLVGLFENGLNGILGDEMGLGKTIQTIALIAHLVEQKVHGPFLLVVPLSTMMNWLKELNKWCPTIEAVRYHGNREERRDLIPDLKRRYRSSAHQFIVVTTYEIVNRDRANLQKFKWKYIIVDEGHRLKNPNCLLFRELSILCRGPVIHGGANRLLLTGTPLQNNLTELWSLLNFLMPEIFDSLDFFKSVFAFDAKITQKEDNSLVEDQEKKQIVSKLHTILAPFMLRRLKREVEKELPKKKEVVLYCKMAKGQRQMYQSLQNRTLRADIARVEESFSKKSLMNLLMQLRKISLHPFLMYEHENEAGEFTTDKTIYTTSGKMLLLHHILTKLLKEKRKVLIFSQFTTMLDIIEDYLTVLRPNVGFCRIDGSIKVDDRQRQMDDFNDESNNEKMIFMLSTRSGGVGINLVAADTVIIFDSDFNPHQDNQAQDRAHRIGQTKDVTVLRFITGDSVELRVLERANDKRKLERVVCASQARINRTKATLGKEELQRLLTDDFSGHHKDRDIGFLEPSNYKETIDKILDRDALFANDGRLPKKGQGYEIVEFKSDSLVGELA